jgi:hypothetical protein
VPGRDVKEGQQGRTGAMRRAGEAARGAAPYLRPTIGRPRTSDAQGASRPAILPDSPERRGCRARSEARAPPGIPGYQARAERSVKPSRPDPGAICASGR